MIRRVTLVVATLALLIALATLAALDYVRSIVLTRSGVRLDNLLAARVLGALVERANQVRGTERGQTLRDLDAFRHVVLDRCDQYVPAGGEFQPVPAQRLGRNEGATALLAMKQPLFAQDIDGLPHRDPRHLKFLLQLHQS